MFDSRQLNCVIRDRTATITPTSRPCQGFLVALYRTYRYAYLWWPGVEVADETMVAPHFFRGALAQLRIHLSLVARFEPAEKTVFASRNVSALLSFTPLPIASPVKGSRQLCCRGVELKAINYQLSALRCGHRSLVGNGFIRSACRGFIGTHRSGYRNECIGISVDAPLKKRAANGRPYDSILLPSKP